MTTVGNRDGSPEVLALARTPSEVLADMQRRSARFWMGTAMRPEAIALERQALLSKQPPVVAIVSCSEVRVPADIVFDQGLADIFVIRVAGTALETATLASLHYALHYLTAKVLIALGHEMCGMAKAAQLPVETFATEMPTQLQEALTSIKVGVGLDRPANLHYSRALNREAVANNVKKQVGRLATDKGFQV